VRGDEVTTLGDVTALGPARGDEVVLGRSTRVMTTLAPSIVAGSSMRGLRGI